MNLLFLLRGELDEDGASARLGPEDPRFVHILEVLNAQQGRELRCALVDGPVLTGAVEWIHEPLEAVFQLPVAKGSLRGAFADLDAEARAAFLERLARVPPAGASSAYLHLASSSAAAGGSAAAGDAVSGDAATGDAATGGAAAVPFALGLRGKGAEQRLTVMPRRAGCQNFGRDAGNVDPTLSDLVVTGLRLRFAAAVPAPAAAPAVAPPVAIDVVLACPRPKVVERLFASLATFGVRRVFLIKATKTEPTYFDGKRLAASNIDECLLEGLTQGACYTRRPNVEVYPRSGLAAVLTKLDSLGGGLRIVAHPGAETERLGTLLRRAHGAATAGLRSVTLAIGPEGGWTDEEVAALIASEFRKVVLGPRILKTSDATISLLALLFDALEDLGLEQPATSESPSAAVSPSAARSAGGGSGGYA
eukprot:TRINITY_DN10043_c0_g1_i1.p1 TRINITY_DN10043_c0_g1~~TRINITY_DN10043_c0_g1_i1.p1  ORF type:complete len:440 (+),score=107.60 TRINITY_DN10043_c0_g1_i1:60-1322(+)